MTDITVPTFQTLGAGAAEGADRMSHIVLGPEKHARVSETVGAFGTIAKYIAGINDTARDWETEYEDFVDYGEVHDTHYIASQYQRAYTDYQVVLQTKAIRRFVITEKAPTRGHKGRVWLA